MWELEGCNAHTVIVVNSPVQIQRYMLAALVAPSPVATALCPVAPGERESGFLLPGLHHCLVHSAWSVYLHLIVQTNMLRPHLQENLTFSNT